MSTLTLIGFFVVASLSPASSSDDVLVEREVEDLEQRLIKLRGSDPYIVIDTTQNRLTVRQGNAVLRNAICATGSGKVLLGDPGQMWNFRTPKRVFRVQKKVKDPVWKKPVWAFVERNEQAPVLPWSFERLDPNTLGAFALELENSYAIHGTLYPTLLGRHLTHGCVRLGDDDLEATYRYVEPGTVVYIF